MFPHAVSWYKVIWRPDAFSLWVASAWAQGYFTTLERTHPLPLMPPNTEGCHKHSALWHHLCYSIYSFHGLILNSAVLFKPVWGDRVKQQAEAHLL